MKGNGKEDFAKLEATRKYLTKRSVTYLLD